MTVLAVAVASASSVIWVGLSTLRMEVPSGMPAPEMAMPGVLPASPAVPGVTLMTTADPMVVSPVTVTG